MHTKQQHCRPLHLTFHKLIYLAIILIAINMGNTSTVRNGEVYFGVGFTMYTLNTKLSYSHVFLKDFVSGLLPTSNCVAERWDEAICD